MNIWGQDRLDTGYNFIVTGYFQTLNFRRSNNIFEINNALQAS